MANHVPLSSVSNPTIPPQTRKSSVISRKNLLESGRPSSYYRRSPRRNYLARTFKKLRRLLRDLVFYMKRHPYQVLLLVIMPLILSGTLAKLLAKFGIRLPAGLQKALKIVTGGVRRIQSKSSSWSSSTRNILGGVGTLGGLLGMIKMIK
ncbi:hypothetical protein OnM2_094002 [Erysiphe neolycopersici]|uniref:Uncharacterized protein n=1 Tax=Erysiphe neolycopersici TaxID=212602 RepID=A0A420HBH5_9PEZI|nr:hypothetical protein OnM2_094002 [Erysiphe neolycopersici]